MEKIEIGTIVNTFGLKGELKVLPKTNCEQYFKNLKTFEISKNSDIFECEKISAKQDKFLRLKIKGFDDINQVEKFKNKSILVETNQKPELAENEYLVEDLIGCELYQNSTFVAKLVDVENFGATDIFVLEYDGKEARVPYVSDYIENIDIKSKKIQVTEHFFEGLVI